jgi:hypothetical protein
MQIATGGAPNNKNKISMSGREIKLLFTGGGGAFFDLRLIGALSRQICARCH